MSKTQLHKRLSDYQVTAVLEKYQTGTIKAKQAQTYLSVSKSQFYKWVVRYKKNQKQFTIVYSRHTPNNGTKVKIKTNILHELKVEKEIIIDNPNVPTNHYNYSYIQKLIKEKYDQDISVPTVIKIARNNGYYKPKRKKQNTHTRQVLANCIGELVQHDSSHHLFAPDGKLKWYLITSIDDYSRFLLYAELALRESSLAHIEASESVCIKYGIALKYYVDQHSIFRYVKHRDQYSVWKEYEKFTDDVDPQWKMMINDLGIEPIYALSAQAKGKIERPYQWLQDHLVRTCVRNGVIDIQKGREILKQEVYEYNYRRVHSTTGEIPGIRFNRALNEGKTLFRPFEIPKPYESIKDIFCLRATRRTDGYRKISFHGLTLEVPKVGSYEQVELRIYPNIKDKTIEIRFWFNKQLTGAITVEMGKLPLVSF